MTNWAREMLTSEYSGAPLAARLPNGFVLHEAGKLKRAVLQSKPVHFFQNSEWHEIDTNLVAGGDGSYGAPGLSSNIGSLGEVSVAGKLYKQFTSGAGTVDVNTMTYNNMITFGSGALNGDRYVREIGPHFHEIILTEKGIKEQVTLASLPANLTGTHFGTYTVLDGVNIAYEGVVPDGTVVGGVELLGGVASDANGDTTRVIRYVKQIAGKPVFLSVVPISWLENAAYPVVIDPTFSVQPDGAVGYDSFSNEADPTQNEGGTGRLWSGRYFGDYRTSYIKFNVSSIHPAAVIASAGLSLKLEIEQVGAVQTLEAFILRRNWTEGGVNWNTYNGSASWGTTPGINTSTDIYSPAEDGVYFSTTAGGSIWYTWSLPLGVKDFITGAKPNYGWHIVGNSGSNNTGKAFYSSDTGTAANRPKLEVVYYLPGHMFTVVS